VLFIALARDNAFLGLFGGSRFFLNGDKPAGSLGVGTGLEGVLLSMELERELVEALLGNLGDFSLSRTRISKGQEV